MNTGLAPNGPLAHRPGRPPSRRHSPARWGGPPPSGFALLPLAERRGRPRLFARIGRLRRQARPPPSRPAAGLRPVGRPEGAPTLRTRHLRLARAADGRRAARAHDARTDRVALLLLRGGRGADVLRGLA